MALTFKCKCGSPYVLKNYNKHTKTCPKFLIECKLCKKQILREKMLDSSSHTTECYFIKHHLRSEEIKFLKNQNELLNAQYKEMSERLQEVATLNKILSGKFERFVSQNIESSAKLQQKFQNLERKVSDQNFFSKFECTECKIDSLRACLAAQNIGFSERIRASEKRFAIFLFSNLFFSLFSDHDSFLGTYKNVFYCCFVLLLLFFA